MSWVKSLFASAIMAVTALPATSFAQDPVPLDFFALREVIQNVELSPDGKHLSLMKIEGRDGDPIIEIYETDDLTKKPIRVGADPMEFTGQSWINNDFIVFSVRQRLYSRIQDYNQGVFVGRFAAYNVKTKKFEVFGDNIGLENVLPDKPNSVLISEARSNTSFDEDDPFAAFRPRVYYELNLKTGSKSLVFKGSEKIATAGFDSEGRPRNAQGYDPSTKELVYYFRMPTERSWDDVYRRDSRNFEDFNPVGFKKDSSGIGYVITTNGNDVYGLWEFDWNTGQYGDLVFRHPEADVRNVINHPNNWEKPGQIVGLQHYGYKPINVWFDDEMETLYQTLEGVIPQAYNLSVTSMSRDESKFIVFNSGPHDPGSYYLVNNGQLKLIGKHLPLVRPEQLADVEFLEYTSRDGRKIRGYITIPSTGKPPYPTINMPHGGCFAGEMPGWDEWAQVWASRGYMVFQPQFLCSRGWGQKHYIDFLGTGGGKQQDDKDDGIIHLINKGLTDPDRVAMYGWSYGGYAAAIAASRSPNLYQCTLPGAAVLDTSLQKFYNTKDTRFDASLIFAEKRYAGLNPIDEVDKVNVPMLLIHGDVDQRVPYEHYKRYEKALKAAGKDYKTLVLEEADHFYTTLFYRHQLALYEGVIDFLENDCGPGGL